MLSSSTTPRPPKPWCHLPATPDPSTDAYELLEADAESAPATSREARRNQRRRRRRVVYSVLSLAGLGMLLSWHCWNAHSWGRASSSGRQSKSADPPLYEVYRARERLLPQHTQNLSTTPDRDVGYLWFANHGEEFGWGNYMQEMLLNAYLAYAAGRSYVFDDYTWYKTGPEIVTSWKTGRRIPARIPLSALISGPIVGGEMPEGDASVRPRAVSREHFLNICPQSARVVLDTSAVNAGLDTDASVERTVQHWVAELAKIDSPCVEIAEESPALFSYNITNTPRVLSVFPTLSASPILSSFGWSPLILSEFYTNLHHFGSVADVVSTTSTTATPTSPLKGLLALHIRRGDYESWCGDAYKDGMGYTGFNSFPELSDRYPGPTQSKGKGKSKSKDELLSHCLPTIQQITTKVRAVLHGRIHDGPHGHPPLSRVYIMTNAGSAWLARLVRALRTSVGVDVAIATSDDLEMTWEGQYVAQALDMYVAQRAEVFIGNGFSSLTSNVVLLRMHNRELDVADTHFW
ncbi:hypothetical protein MKEN_00405700 [Mycena kentingensis (nom. inval.)]|nr:hypothetical protein MKEN_00405700 [Mycena kentingensis (nom. inval.)]